MLLRFDPFRELDRVAEQAWGRSSQNHPLAMDAVRRGDSVVIAFDFPGVDPSAIDLTVERNVLTVRADRKGLAGEGDQVIASERRAGSVTRQLLLGDTLDTDAIQADYTNGVLTLTIPAAEEAKPKKVAVTSGSDSSQVAIEGSASEAS
jgi:HSP20 family protein